MGDMDTEGFQYRKWSLLACFCIIGIHTLFILSYWPGVLGPDSLAVLSQIEGHNPHGSGKSAFWFFFVELLYDPWRRIETVTIALGLISSLTFCRICTYLIKNQHFKSFIFCAIFIFLAPHIIVMNIAIYPDGIFAVAMAGFFFEIYICTQQKKISKKSFIIIIILSAFGIFSRSNGIISFIPLLALCILLHYKERAKALAIVFFNIAILVTLNTTYKYPSQDASFPLALWETTNFLQPRASQLATAQGRVSSKAIETLEQIAPLRLINSYYDPEYWDPLIFDPNGPQLGRLNYEQRKIITKEFIKHNLWRNFPQFIASRVRLFLATALATSGLPWPGYTKDLIDKISTTSSLHPLKSWEITKFPEAYFTYTFIHRHFFWSSLYGILLIIFCAYSFRKKSIQGIISTTYLLQIGGIFAFSIAAENRYMLCLTLAPLVLLPMLADRHIKKPTLFRTDPNSTRQNFACSYSPFA